MINDDEKKSDNKGQTTGTSTSEIRYIPLDVRTIENEGDGIDLEETIVRIWNGRRIIFKTVVIFLIIGLLIAFLSVNEYSSEVKVLPEANESFTLGALGTIAQQFGFSSTPQQSSEGISAIIYPEIINSNIFIQELMNYKVTLSDRPDIVTLEEYFQEYVKWPITKYTIYLPLTLKNWLIRNDEHESTNIDRSSLAENKLQRITNMSNEDWETVRQIKDRISASMDSETGIVTVNVKMQDPLIAADIADEVVRMLSEFVTEKRTEKVRRNVEFIEERFEEAKIRFENAQQELAEFNDENRGQLTAMALTQQKLLQSKYDLSFNVYNSMAERLEEARIELQKETPVVNILEPAAIPDQRTEPKRLLILIIYFILGLIVGVTFVFGTPFLLRLQARFN